MHTHARAGRRAGGAHAWHTDRSIVFTSVHVHAWAPKSLALAAAVSAVPEPLARGSVPAHQRAGSPDKLDIDLQLAAHKVPSLPT